MYFYPFAIKQDMIATVRRAFRDLKNSDKKPGISKKSWTFNPKIS